jgi:hypothetical protein
MNLAELVGAGLAREGVAVTWSRAGRRSYAGYFWATSIIRPVNSLLRFRAAAKAAARPALAHAAWGACLPRIDPVQIDGPGP